MKRIRITVVLIAGASSVVAPALVLLSGSSASAAVGTQAASAVTNGTFIATSDDVTLGDASAPTGLSISCGSSTVMGDLGGDSDSDLGTITSGVLADCTDPLGDSWSGAISSGVAVAESSDSTGTISGDISGFSASVSGAILGNACSFDVTGDVPFAYLSSSGSGGQASVGQGTVSSLTLSNVTGTGCSLIGINNGDLMGSISAIYAVTISNGVIPEGIIS